MVCKTLKSKRQAEGLTQFALSQRSGVHPTTISHLERGYIQSCPSVRQKLAIALDMKEEELFPEFYLADSAR